MDNTQENTCLLYVLFNITNSFGLTVIKIKIIGKLNIDKYPVKSM